MVKNNKISFSHEVGEELSSFSGALAFAANKLTAVTETPELEAEILLAHILQKSRSFLHAWPDTELTSQQEKDFQAFIERRLTGEPIAYITGHQEFWSLDLIVTPDTLIPRPETELLVELVLANVKGENRVIADLGTGSGAIALAIAKEKPSWKIYATDNSAAALEIAQLNAKNLRLNNLSFHQGSWLEALSDLNIQFDAIVSNPPYIAAEDKHLQPQVLKFEPKNALITEENGLADIRSIIHEAKSFLKKESYLFLEHGFQQGIEVRTLLQEAGYKMIKTYLDLSKKERVTAAMS